MPRSLVIYNIVCSSILLLIQETWLMCILFQMSSIFLIDCEHAFRRNPFRICSAIYARMSAQARMHAQAARELLMTVSYLWRSLHCNRQFDTQVHQKRIWGIRGVMLTTFQSWMSKELACPQTPLQSFVYLASLPSSYGSPPL